MSYCVTLCIRNPERPPNAHPIFNAILLGFFSVSTQAPYWKRSSLRINSSYLGAPWNLAQGLIWRWAPEMFAKCWAALKVAWCLKRADSQELAQTCKNISKVNRKKVCFHCRVFRAELTPKAGQSALIVMLTEERITRLQLHFLHKGREPPAGHGMVGSKGLKSKRREGRPVPRGSWVSRV